MEYYGDTFEFLIVSHHINQRVAAVCITVTFLYTSTSQMEFSLCHSRYAELRLVKAKTQPIVKSTPH